ncbi:thiamine-phosphate kinase [Alkalibacillus aidingensis]|uniref:thiamine-phosphate kinase n=1 Tax=Alkalibacillus aidingensis TaxID=2747607 RepID=UPI0016615FD2|nr:thiamine-phosphate kinase [Alkalibacillus aidingensis]
MDEFELINKIKPTFYQQPSVMKGIGDDGAVIRPADGHELVVVSDTMVEDVHFSLDYMSFEDIGHRVLAANISDLVAMGSTPLYFLVNIAVSGSIQNEQIYAIYNGMSSLATTYRMDLIGGDTVSAKQLMISITAFGSVLPWKKRLRSQAEPNDVVFVTGNLGEAGYGFYVLKENSVSVNSTYFANRHKRPIPRVDFISASRHIRRLSLNDLSDGLSSELNEIAEASNVNIEVDFSHIPIHEQMRYLGRDKLKKLTLSAGEDFELVGTCSPEEWKVLKSECEKVNIPIKAIGHVTSKGEQAQVWLKEDNLSFPLKRNGYKHS